MDCSTLFYLVLLGLAVWGGIKLYLMIWQPETYIKLKRAEEERRRAEEERKLVRAERMRQHVGLGLTLLRWFMR